MGQILLRDLEINSEGGKARYWPAARGLGTPPLEAEWVQRPGGKKDLAMFDKSIEG